MKTNLFEKFLLNIFKINIFSERSFEVFI